jgi:hypothetical protein
MCGTPVGSDGVVLIKGRPADTRQSLMLSREEKKAIEILREHDVIVFSLSDIHSDVVVCGGCWKTKLEPIYREEVDDVVKIIASGPEKKPEITNPGNLMAEYYIHKLAELLDSSDRNVVGWVLYVIFSHLWIYSLRTRELATTILLPRVQQLHHEDKLIQRAADLVKRKYDGEKLNWTTWWINDDGTWYEALEKITDSL